MAVIPNDIQTQINNMYNNQRNTQLSQLQAEQQKAVGQINQQKTATNQQYYDSRNQADVGHFQSRKGLAEMMAASGLSRSGENISANVGLNASRQNVLGGLNREENNAINAFNQKITEINDPSRKQSIIDAIEAQRSAALSEALQKEIEQAEQKRQFEAQLAWQKEQFNRQLAEQAKSRARSSTSRGSGSSSKSSSSSSDKSLADLYAEYKGSDNLDLNILQKRSHVPARKASKSYADLMSGGGGGGGPLLRIGQY